MLISAGVTTALAASTLAVLAFQGRPGGGGTPDDPDLAAVATAMTTTSAAPTRVVAPAVADTYVIASQPNVNNGYKKWAFATTSENRAFVRFDTAKVIPAGSRVTAARLKVYVLKISKPGAAGFTAHPLPGSWSETGTTAKNRPAFVASPVSARAAVPAARQWVTLTIAPSAVSTTGTTSLELLHSVGYSEFQFATRESATPPALELELASGTSATTAPTTTKTTTKKATTTTTAPQAAPAYPDADVASSGDLPFDMPSASALRTSSTKKLVFAHYMPPFRRSIDNKPPSEDYWQRNYVNPMGESGKHKAYGGFTRDRPLGREPLSGNYEMKDLQAEVRQAISAGIDGFTVDLLSLTSANWTRSVNMLDAAQSVDPNFKIVPMPDMTTLGGETQASLAKAIAVFDKHPSAFHLPDGRLVVSPFKAENRSASWWKEWLKVAKNSYGVDVAFVPTFLDWQKHFGDFASFSYGVSHWGVANTAAAANTAKHAKLAHSMGKLWMAPVRVQDVRPNQGIYDEADNSATLRLAWQGVIDGGADWVQIVTWNDYTEGTHIAPSANHGWTFLDLSSYYITAWKTGSKPTIKRDGLYVVHRTHSYSVKPSFPQSKLVSLRSGTPSPVNHVEVVAFLKSAATVKVKVGGSTYTWDAPAGMSAKDFPLATGTVSASVQRSGSVTTSLTSPYTITGSPYVQNLEYAAAGSLR